MRVAQSCLGLWGVVKVSGVMSPLVGGSQHPAANVDL